jgi:undecaprenyl-diphosphatase
VILAAGALTSFCLVATLRILAETSFDYPLILAANTFARRSRIVDHALQAVATFDLFQGLPIVALAYGAFFATPDGRERVRLAAGIVAASGAAILSRLLQFLMPSLSRPTVDPALPFRRPYGGSPDWWRDWSSFPSDHATLLWGMTFAILMANRRIGALAVLVATLSSISRVYCGLHYATDLVGGALLGIAVVCACLVGSEPWEERLLSGAKQRPALVATLAFLIGAQAATFFHDLRGIAETTARTVKDITAVSSRDRPAPARSGEGPLPR